VWCLVFFALAELGFRLLPRSFFLTMDQHDYAHDDTLDYTAVELAVEMLPPPEVAVIGTSRAREGVPVPALERELRRSLARPVEVRNYGTAGGRIDVWLVLVDRLIRAGKQPDVLVVALDGSDFRDAEPLGDRYRLLDLDGLAADVFRNGWPGEKDMTPVLGNSMPLRMLSARPTIRYRLVRRGEMNAGLARRSDAAFGGNTAWAREYERTVRRQGLPPRMSARRKRIAYTRGGYVISERAIDRLRELVNLATTNGVKVVLAQVPESPPVRDAPAVQRAQERVRAEMRALAGAADTWVWTAEGVSDRFGWYEYRDTSHLNPRGAERFVEQIAPLVARALAGKPRP